MKHHAYSRQFIPFVAGLLLACTPVLTYAVCVGGVPNGVLDQGEECDDGSAVDGDGCDSNCTFTGCGNGIVTTGEECDDGNNIPGDGCGARCPDGAKSCTTDSDCAVGESCQCDVDGCVCSPQVIIQSPRAVCVVPLVSTCTLEPGSCGNAEPEAGEQCDDGNIVSGDGCDSNCTVTGCGNGIVTAGEECDDGNNISGDGCGADCPDEVSNCATDSDCATDEFCQCDIDGCVCTPQIIIQSTRVVCESVLVPNCEREVPLCGDGVLDPGEQCDLGADNGVSRPGCTLRCTPLEGTCFDSPNIPVFCPEPCSDLIDNDGNGFTDCADPGCQDVVSPCVVLRRDPARIVFRAGAQKQDRFAMHGRLKPSTPIDPANETVGVSLENANGVLYRATLEPGALKARSGLRQFRFTNRRASARSDTGGVNRFFIRKRPDYFTVTVKAYGDLSAATLPYMSIRVVVGDDEFNTEGLWRRTATGWWIRIP